MDQYLERISCNWSDDSVRLIHTPAPGIKSTFFYIQEAGYFKTVPPYFTERKNLDSFLVILTLSGSGRLLYEGSEYTLGKGDVFWIHCMNHHYYECLKDCEWEFLWIHFHGIGSHGFYQAFTASSRPVIAGINDEAAELARNMQAVIPLVRIRNYSSDIKISQHLHTILNRLILTAQKEDSEHPAVPKHINIIIAELEKHYRDKITLDDLARKYGISKFYLSRQFKKHTGSPVGEYLIMLRINHAKELLKYSDCTISEIAGLCGVTNVSHFIRMFRDREGKTPLQYRNEWN